MIFVKQPPWDNAPGSPAIERFTPPAQLLGYCFFLFVIRILLIFVHLITPLAKFRRL